MAEAFSAEELKGVEDWCDNIEASKVKIVHAQVPVETLGDRRFLATITADRKLIRELKQIKESDTAIKKDHRVKMKADRKRIECLEDLKKDAHINLKERSAKIVGFRVLIKRKDETIADQTAEIDEQRKFVDLQQDRIEKLEEEIQRWEDADITQTAEIGRLRGELVLIQKSIREIKSQFTMGHMKAGSRQIFWEQASKKIDDLLYSDDSPLRQALDAGKE